MPSDKDAKGVKGITHEDGSTPDRLAEAAREARAKGDLSQAEKFERAAEALGCDPDNKTFEGVLRKLAKPKER